jgi:transcriptional regulator with XRE-family HTH domain
MKPNIGQNIRDLRTARNRSQRSIAEALKMSYTYYSHIETNKAPGLSITVLQRIADALECHIRELFV